MNRQVFGAMLIALGISTAVAAHAGLAEQGNDEQNDHERARVEGYAVGMWGDLPYSDLQATIGVPNLIADMNQEDLAFTVHNGDLKAGSGTPGSSTPTTCTDALYEQALFYFNSLEAPAIFTPGDNDWTDCDRPANGGFWSLERLDHERAVTVLARATSPPSGGANRSLVPRCDGSSVVRRAPALDDSRRHLRDAEYSGLVQQPVRHGTRSGGVVRA